MMMLNIVAFQGLYWLHKLPPLTPFLLEIEQINTSSSLCQGHYKTWIGWVQIVPCLPYTSPHLLVVSPSGKLRV
jgi:hypothetical protein